MVIMANIVTETLPFEVRKCFFTICCEKYAKLYFCFQKVFLHGMITDLHGKKMSKPNNVADASLYAMFSVVFGANHY